MIWPRSVSLLVFVFVCFCLVVWFSSCLFPQILALKGFKYDLKRQLIDTYNHTVPPKDAIPLDCLEDKGSLAAKITAGFVKVGL